MGLPKEFEDRMKKMLGEEFEAFLRSYEEERSYGFRANQLKIEGKDLLALLDLNREQIPWTEDGFFCEEADHLSKHPAYFAGLYYLQEPSAMLPAALLPVMPGDRVLDLCAAPGGKATKLAGKLAGQGILVANEISRARAKALLKNVELTGAKNVMITNERPQVLRKVFPQGFNRILVDAPCSGEGMFRKEREVMEVWKPDRPEYFSALQKEILAAAYDMLEPGGILLYSTCTFAPAENEETVSWFLDTYQDMKLLPVPMKEGFSKGRPEWGKGNKELEKCLRLWPHKIRGEGHFIALFQKEGKERGEIPACFRAKKENGAALEKGKKKQAGRKDREERKVSQEEALVADFMKDIPVLGETDRLQIRKGMAYQVPALLADIGGIRFVRNGLFLGEVKKGRFEPSQSLAMAIGSGDYDSVLSLGVEDPRLDAYLKGQTLAVGQGETARDKGWQLVCMEGYPLGWGKLVNGVLKNKYLVAWRKNQ